MKFPALLEAAKKLADQAKEKFVDPNDLTTLLSEVAKVEAATEADEKKPVNDDSKGEGEAEPDADENAAKELEEAKEKGVNPFAKSKESKTPEDDVRKSHPAIFEAAFKEAQAVIAKDTKATLDTLREQVAQANAKASLRESIDLAKGKLKASNLPESAAIRLLETIVGKSAEDMDRLIENESKYLADIGFKQSAQRVEGNRERMPVRESEGTSNTAAIFAGIGE